MEFSDQIQASSRKKSGIGEPADNAGGWFDVSDHAAPKEVTTALALLDGTLRDNPNSRINGLHSAGTMDRWWTAVEKVIREALTDARTPITGNFNTEMSKALQHELSLHALEDYVPQQLINSPSAAGVASTQQERDHRQQQYERARNAVTAAIVRWVWHNALTSELRAEASNDMAHEWVLHGPMKTGTAYHYAAIKTYSTNPVNCIELDLLRGVFDRDLHGMMLAEHSQGRFGDMCRRLEETSVRLVGAYAGRLAPAALVREALRKKWWERPGQPPDAQGRAPLFFVEGCPEDQQHRVDGQLHRHLAAARTRATKGGMDVRAASADELHASLSQHRADTAATEPPQQRRRGDSAAVAEVPPQETWRPLYGEHATARPLLSNGSASRTATTATVEHVDEHARPTPRQIWRPSRQPWRQHDHLARPHRPITAWSSARSAARTTAPRTRVVGRSR